MPQAAPAIPDFMKPQAAQSAAPAVPAWMQPNAAPSPSVAPSKSVSAAPVVPAFMKPSASAQPAPPPGLVRDAGAGAVKGVTGLAGAASGLVNGIINPYTTNAPEPYLARFGRAPVNNAPRTGLTVGKIASDVTPAAIAKLAGQIAAWADATHPQTLAGQAVEGAGEMVPFVAGQLIPGAGEADDLSVGMKALSKLRETAMLGVSGAGAGVGQHVGAAAGQQLDGKTGAEIGGTIGALAGGLAPGAGAFAADKAVSGLLDAAPVTKAAKARWALQNIQHFEPDLTAARAKVASAGSALQVGPDIVHRGPVGEILPGSVPTVAQLSRSQPLARLQEGLKTTDAGAPLLAADQAQTGARAAAVRNIGPVEQGNPSAVAAHLKQQFALDDKTGQQAVNAATSGVGNAVAQQPGLSGVVTPYKAGQDLQGTLAANDAARKATTSALYNKLTEKNPIVDMGPLGDTVDAIHQEVAGNKGIVSPVERDLLSRAQDLAASNDTTWRQVNQLRSDLNSEITGSLDRFGQNTPVTRRLSMLKSGVDGALADAAAKVVQAEPEAFPLDAMDLPAVNGSDGSGAVERRPDDAGGLDSSGNGNDQAAGIPAGSVRGGVAPYRATDDSAGQLSGSERGSLSSPHPTLGAPPDVAASAAYKEWQREYQKAQSDYQKAAEAHAAMQPETGPLFNSKPTMKAAAKTAQKVDIADARRRVAAYAMDSLASGRDAPYVLKYSDAALNKRIGAPPASPQGILGRIRELGGIAPDRGGELASRDLNRVPGLVNSKSRYNLEKMATQMAEEGYLPELRQDMESNGPAAVDRHEALLNALDDHQHGMPVYPENQDHAYREAQYHFETVSDARRHAAQWIGIPESQAKVLTRGQIQDIVAERASFEQMAEEYQSAISRDNQTDPDIASAIQQEIDHGYAGGNGPIEGETFGGGPGGLQPEAAAGDQGWGGQSGKESRLGNVSSGSAGSQGEAHQPQPLTPDDAADYQRALASHAERKSLYANPLIAPILKRAPGGDLSMAPESVVKNVVARGAPMARAIKATAQDNGSIMGQYETAIGLDARRAFVDPSGSINVAKLNAWKRANKPLLDEMPQVAQRLDNAAKAQSMVDEAVQRHAEALKAYEGRAFQSLLHGDDPQVAMRTLLSGTPQDARKFMARMSNNPDALNGARQSMADHLASSLLTPIAGAESAEEAAGISSVRALVKNPAKMQILRDTLGPNAPAHLRRILQDFDAYNTNALSRINAGGSRTMPLQQIARELSEPKTIMGRIVGQLSSPLGAAVAGGITHPRADLGAQAAAAMFRGWRGKHLTAATELLSRALADPKVFMEVTRPIPKSAGAAAALMRRARYALANSYLNRAQDRKNP